MGDKCSKRILEKNLRDLHENHSEMSKRIEIKAVNVDVQGKKNHHKLKTGWLQKHMVQLLKC